MFQFPECPLLKLFIHFRILSVQLSEFPHSEICGSQDMCSYPQLIAAYHVLHRLLVPRHSPCALSNLTFVRIRHLLIALSKIFEFLGYLLLIIITNFSLIIMQFSKNISVFTKS